MGKESQMTTLSVTRAFRARMLVALFALLLLGVSPAVASAGSKTGHYRVRGMVVANTGDSLTVCVGTQKKSTNKLARIWQGTEVVFDISGAQVVTHDQNGDGARDAADLYVGSPVRIKSAKLPVDLDNVPAPFEAEQAFSALNPHGKAQKGYEAVCEHADGDDDSDGGDGGTPTGPPPWDGGGMAT